MKKLCLAVLLASTLFGAQGLMAKVTTGETAPDFTLTAQDGKTYSLSDFKGQHVVLEWFNEDCPYVKKHYESQNMQKLQRQFTDQGAAWLMLASSPEGQQGYLTAEQASEVLKAQKASPTALLLDPEGEVGRAYGAQTTPHMFVINPKGQVVYQGAIDDKPSTRPSTLEDATPYFANALTASLKGETISPSDTKPYGCSIKYRN